MAKLLAAIDERAFNWYPKWIELNNKGLPKNPIKDGMSQPLTIKIVWSTSNGHEMSYKVTPDKIPPYERCHQDEHPYNHDPPTPRPKEGSGSILR